MKEVLIAGAGGLGREVHAWLLDSPDCGKEWRPVAYLDDDPAAADRPLPLPVAGTIREYQPAPDQWIVNAIGNPRPRRAVAKALRERGAVLLTYIHPTAIVGPRVTIGDGTVVCPRCVFTCDIEIGDHCFFNLAVTVGHDVRIGPGCCISSQVDLCGGVELGEGVAVSSGARVIPLRRIGADARIGAGSVVLRHVPPGTSVFGVPAKRI